MTTLEKIVEQLKKDYPNGNLIFEDGVPTWEVQIEVENPVKHIKVEGVIHRDLLDGTVRST